MHCPSSPTEVANSDPYAPPEDLPVLLLSNAVNQAQNQPDLSLRTRTLKSTGNVSIVDEHHAPDDIVPDSDPPYPDWLPLVVPLGWPHVKSNDPTVAAASGGKANRSRTAQSQSTGVTRRSIVSLEMMPAEPDSMIDIVETLLPWEPSKPVSDAYQYPYAESSDVSEPESFMGNFQNPVMEEPTSDDEIEYRRGVEDEMEMDGILYGSPEIRPSPGLSISREGEEPTSEDERVWRGQLELSALQGTVTELRDMEGGTFVGERYCGGDGGYSSPFEEGQRPPWHGRLRLHEMTPSESPAESSEDEVVCTGVVEATVPSADPDRYLLCTACTTIEQIPATNPGSPQSLGVFSRIAKGLPPFKD